MVWLRLCALACSLGLLVRGVPDTASDAAAFVQTASNLHVSPADSEIKGDWATEVSSFAAGPLRKAANGKADGGKPERARPPVVSFRAGEEAEIVVLEGKDIGSWVPCTILKEDKLKDTYTINVPQAPEGRQTMENIPGSILRKPPPEVDLGKNISDGVLLFWAVGSKDYTLDLVMQNIDHLRDTYDGPVDVYLAHYDGQQDAWLTRDETWYKTNIQYSGFKNWRIKRTKPGGFPPQLILAQEFLPDLLAKKQYRWVWLLDEAIDFRNTNMTRLFADAFGTKSLIAAPTVVLGNRTGDEVDQIVYGKCEDKYTACKVHVSHPECTYRYVNFVDMMFPLVHPRALMEIYNSCEACMHQIDHIWCYHTAHKLKKPEHEACAILDQVSVGHTNSISLKKLGVKVNLKDAQDAKSLHKDAWVDGDDIRTLECVK